MKLSSLLAVALGGAVGSVLRYLISLIPFDSRFPTATLIANLAGAVIIGFIAGYTSQRDVSRNIVLMMKTGLCGGFTTFSTFSLEAFTMLENGRRLMAIVYIGISLFGCLAGIWVGMTLGKYTAKA